MNNKSKKISVGRLLDTAVAFLRPWGLANPRLEAEVLLAHLLHWDRVRLYSHSEEEVEIAMEYQKLLERRAKGEPTAYLTGRKEFMGLELAVSPAVLIPRPETELLVEKALEFLADRPKVRAADVGTGSGAIALSLAYYEPKMEVWALDISEAALQIARQNRLELGLEKQVQLLSSDLLTALPNNCQLDLIVANLPYIPRSQLPTLMREVRDFEPALALDGGGDGLELYRRLLPQAEKVLISGGLLLLEIMTGQGAILENLMQENWADCGMEKDLAGQERIFWGLKR